MDWSYLLAIAAAPFAAKAIEKWDERDRRRRAEKGLPPEGYMLGFRIGRIARWLAPLSKAAHDFLIRRNLLWRRNATTGHLQAKSARDERRGDAGQRRGD